MNHFLRWNHENRGYLFSTKKFQNEVTKEKLKFYKKKTVYFSNFEQELSILI